MIKKLVWLSALLFTMVTANAEGLKKANNKQAKAMVEQINKTSATIHSMDCNFTQVKTLRFLNDRLTSQGRMLMIADGGRLRWEYRKPYSYTFILNGEKVYIKSGSGNQQTIDIGQSRLFQGIAQVMMNSVTGQGLTSGADFDCTMYTGDGEWVALLVPKHREMKRMFKDIRLHFSNQRQMVTEVEMTEPTGDTTVITLKDVKTNGPIDAKMFAAQ